MTDDHRTGTITEASPTGLADGNGYESSSREPGQDWDPKLFERLHELLRSAGFGSDEFAAVLRKLELRHGPGVYSELIYLMSHLRFPPAEARMHWEQIRDHRDRMQGQMGSTVDMRVALVSYFLEVNRQLRNPKIIEMKLFERTRESAYRDELTGLYNYRLFREYLAKEVERSERLAAPLSLVMIDVDHFKRFNDVNGHELGNRTLATFARLLTSSLRKADIAARYGGEEFALILPSTQKTTAQMLAERIREAVEMHSFAGEEALPAGRLTASMGIATFPADASDAEELVRHADRAMYVAKADGRNQVRLYGLSRRSFDRVHASLPGSYRVLDQVSHPLTTVNISEAGLLFDSVHQPTMGSLVEVGLSLPSGRRIVASGHVVHVEQLGDARFQAAVHLTDTVDEDRDVLVAYVKELAAAQELDPAT